MAPQPGDIGLTQIHGGVGKLIRIGQWLNGDGYADYEHAFVHLGGGEIVEAEPGGARRAYATEYSDVLWLHCPAEHRTAVAAEAESMIGTGYSFLDYGALALHRFHVGWLTRRYVRSSKHVICSQLCNLAAARGGWHLFSDGRLAQDVTPGDLARLARAQH